MQEKSSEPKRIGIIDADLMDNGTRHPNLALMKISGYHKDLGDTVSLIFHDYSEMKDYDFVYISKVFTFTKIPKEALAFKNLNIGGTGFFPDGGKNLPYNIEHFKPDYSLYAPYVAEKIKSGSKVNYDDYCNYSIGFTTRGCFRKCDFCVNKKYDFATNHSPVSEFIDDDRPAIYLWDDNFFAYKGWESILDDLESTGKPFQFRQGLDIRLLTAKKAERFAHTRYHGDIIFAFDHLEDASLVTEKLKLWKDYSTKTTKAYAICGYSSQDIRDVLSLLIRIKILMEHGCVPYIMRHQDYEKSPFKDLYVQLARWCNQPQFFKKKSFREYCKANQDYGKKKTGLCKSQEVLEAFEKEYPTVSSRFFDLRYDEVNFYKTKLYGKRHPYIQSCEYCLRIKPSWDQMINGTIPEEKIISQFFLKNIDLNCLRPNKFCKKSGKECADFIMELTLKTKIKTIVDVIDKSKQKEPITPENIPQFGTFEKMAFLHLDTIYSQKEDSFNMNDLGKLLRSEAGSDVANNKYGENHGKIYCLLNLLDGHYENKGLVVSKNDLGHVYKDLPDHSRNEFVGKMALGIPIIRETIIRGFVNKTSASEIILEKRNISMSQTTIDRRMTNVNMLLTQTIGYFEAEDKKILRKNIDTNEQKSGPR